MNFDGTNKRQLTNTEWKNIQPLWSPDGKKVMFLGNVAPYNKDIFTINSDGTEINNLTRSEGNDWFPSWSPDGAKIAFQSERDGNIEIYVMNSDGKNITRLTKSPCAIDWGPIWHPNGKRIIFLSDMDDSGCSIYMVDLKGKKLRKLVNINSKLSQPDLFYKKHFMN